MKTDISIHPPVDKAKIDCDELHVWRAPIALPLARVETLASCLDADEIARAGKFHLEKDRSRYIAAHGLLRSILSMYLGIESSRIRFSYKENGKPMLQEPCGDDRLHFNLSHSEDVCVFAVARGSEVGIDIERIRRDVAVEDIAENFFSPRERFLLRSMPAAFRHDAFFVWWTCKEAFAKATGEQLSSMLEQLDLTVVSKRSKIHLDAGSQLWSLQTIAAPLGYAGALVSEGERKRLRYREWSEDFTDH
jgi:4'-phosphopantetheinyl transferase